MEISKNNKVLLIGGPTGSGESTITREITGKYPVFQRLITATSRPIRSGEIDKKDYYFFSKEEFEQQIRKGNILEYTYVKNRDAYYGSYKPDFEKKLKKGHLVINVDFVGVLYYKKNYGAAAVFVKPSSLESIEGRIRKRNPEISDDEVKKRLASAKKEITEEEKYYDYTVINDDGKLSEAIKEVEEIIKKEKFI